MTKEEKIRREQETVEEMILLYCRGNHKDGDHPCKECAELISYAKNQSAHCPFMDNKTFCSNCRVHCYKPEMRDKIRKVMRYSGPRMLFHHPVMTIRHLILSKTEKRKLK